MLTEKCPECGATVAGGLYGCDTLFHEMGAQAATDLRIARVHRLIVDAYCMQHVEQYGLSAKSYAAHLVGLCCGIEHDGNPVLYATIPRWLDGSVDLKKPEVLSFRGQMTIADVQAVADVDQRAKCVGEWARCVWDAYVVQHTLAHEWVKLAFAVKDKKKKKRVKLW